MTAMNQERDDAEVKCQRQRHQPQCPVANPAPDAHVGRVHLTSGAVVKLWYGAGEGRVHSRPVGCVPSQTSAVAFLPPRMHCTMTTANRICDSPKANPPMDDTMFQSVNCTA